MENEDDLKKEDNHEDKGDLKNEDDLNCKTTTKIKKSWKWRQYQKWIRRMHPARAYCLYNPCFYSEFLCNIWHLIFLIYVQYSFPSLFFAYSFFIKFWLDQHCARFLFRRLTGNKISRILFSPIFNLFCFLFSLLSIFLMERHWCFWELFLCLCHGCSERGVSVLRVMLFLVMVILSSNAILPTRALGFANQ